METNNIASDSTNPLQLRKRKKNGFRQLEEGAYPRMFVEQVEAAIAAVATGKLRDTRMVRRDRRTNAYLITMGYNMRNTWFDNEYIPRGEVAECDGPEETIRALRTILKAAKAGEFDEALEKLREARQEHARKMIWARDKCGFHRTTTHEGQKLLPPPGEVPMQVISLPTAEEGQP